MLEPPGQACIDGVGQADRLSHVLALDLLRFAEELPVHDGDARVSGSGESS